jgi:hypothetical protein
VYDAAYVPSPSSDHHHPSPLLSVMRARARHAVSIRRFSFSSVPIQKYEIFTKRARSRQGATGKPVLASCELAERQRGWMDGGGGGREGQSFYPFGEIAYAAASLSRVNADVRRSAQSRRKRFEGSLAPSPFHPGR